MGTVLLPAVLCGLGLSLLVFGILLRLRGRDEELASILDLPFGEQDIPVEAVTERANLLFDGSMSGVTDAAGRLVGRFDERGSLQTKLEKARIPLKSGEYVMLTLVGALLAAALLVGITSEPLFGLIGLVAAPFVANALPNIRIAKRKRAFEEQLPDAISLIAGSLSAGHTFLRAIQMMCEEATPPLSEEFARVVQETRLGDSVVDALDRMAQRIDLRDLEWIVQAIRIQQSVGGKLADLLYSLADYIRDREEIRREVKVLTAEGRISAWMLGALPVLVLVVIQVTNPIYMAPFYEGTSLFVLLGAAAAVVGGMAIIFKMVKIEI